MVLRPLNSGELLAMSTSNLHAIVGLGLTGQSFARFLKKRGIPFVVMDSRATPPQLEAFQQLYPEVTIVTGRLDAEMLSRAETILLSPGVPLSTPLIAEQVKIGKPVIGDVELFATINKAPVIAITGTNAKSTVTTLVGLMAEQAGRQVQVGGNLGVPVLDLYLQNSQAELFVLELSSFQLETMTHLRAKVATILNITPDHMDRYPTLAAYQQAKQRVYQGCDTAVCNADDPLTDCHATNKYTFTLHPPKEKQFGLIAHNGETYLAFENNLLMATKELPVLGKHYQANALAALAIGYAAGLPMEAMLTTLRRFSGLAHRCQFVRELQQVKWYNDSKGTNVGATAAAILGLGSEIPGKLLLIAGGVGKGADFASLAPLLKNYVRHVVLIGEAASDIAKIVPDSVQTSKANDMAEAVTQCYAAAKSGDCVLLSPACASFDMFKNFEHRGDMFVDEVNKL